MSFGSHKYYISIEGIRRHYNSPNYLLEENMCLHTYRSFRGYLVCVFKQLFFVFKQYFTYFNTLFHPHVFSQMFLNNNFQFLNIHNKRALSFSKKKKKLSVYACIYLHIMQHYLRSTSFKILIVGKRGCCIMCK